MSKVLFEKLPQSGETHRAATIQSEMSRTHTCGRERLWTRYVVILHFFHTFVSLAFFISSLSENVFLFPPIRNESINQSHSQAREYNYYVSHIWHSAFALCFIGENRFYLICQDKFNLYTEKSCCARVCVYQNGGFLRHRQWRCSSEYKSSFKKKSTLLSTSIAPN